MNKPLIIMKLGGSLITDKSKPFTARHEIIKRLATEIHEARRERDMDIIIGHGGGSFPHTAAAEYQTHKGMINERSGHGIAMVQDAAARLNRIMVSALIEAGENAISMQPSAACIMENDRIIEWPLNTMKKALELGLVPVAYGDVALDVTKGCTIVSTEKLINHISNVFTPEKIIIAGEVDGVFTADPFKDKTARLIPLITQANLPEIKQYLGGSRGTDVTGGMLNKIEELMELARKGYVSEIVNATKPGLLKRALLGENVGTVVRP
jgi:isopentenyl phosphate kinase